MKVFVRTKDTTLAVDLEPTDSVAQLKAKINERMPGVFYKLAYAGKVLEKGTLAENGITAESTVHLNIAKSVSVYIEFEGVTEKVAVPSSSNTIRDLKRYEIFESHFSPIFQTNAQCLPYCDRVWKKTSRAEKGRNIVGQQQDFDRLRHQRRRYFAGREEERLVYSTPFHQFTTTFQ